MSTERKLTLLIKQQQRKIELTPTRRKEKWDRIKIP